MIKLIARAFNRFHREPLPVGCNGCEADKLRSAIDDLAKTVYNDHPTASLTCFEADALARVLVLAGHVDRATDLLVGHSYHDEENEDDAHFLGSKPVSARIAELREYAEWLGTY